MAGKKYQSCLVPYENEIIALRRKKPPPPYSQIAELLRDKHQIMGRRETIHNFLKVRARGFKSCPYVESISADKQQIVEVPSAQKQTVLQTSKPKASPEVSAFDPSKLELTEYSPTTSVQNSR